MHQKIKFIPMKIHKIVTTRAAHFGPDMYQIVCGLGLCPRPHWGSLKRSPRPPSWIKGPTSKGGEGKGREEEERGGERRQPQRLPRAAQMLAPPLVTYRDSSPVHRRSPILVLTVCDVAHTLIEANALPLSQTTNHEVEGVQPSSRPEESWKEVVDSDLKCYICVHPMQ